MQIKFGFFYMCGDCDQPVKSFNICEVLGHNPGIDGHFFNNAESAKKAWELFEQDFLKYGLKSQEESLAWIKENVKLFEFCYEMKENG